MPIANPGMPQRMMIASSLCTIGAYGKYAAYKKVETRKTRARS